MNTQDPLHMDHKREYINGGINLVLEHIHAKESYRMPLKNQAYVLYNMAIKGVYDPELYAKFEEGYKTVSSKHMTSRIAYGGVWAYYKSNQGTMFGVDFWESTLEDHAENVHA